MRGIPSDCGLRQCTVRLSDTWDTFHPARAQYLSPCPFSNVYYLLSFLTKMNKQIVLPAGSKYTSIISKIPLLLWIDLEVLSCYFIARPQCSREALFLCSKGYLLPCQQHYKGSKLTALRVCSSGVHRGTHLKALSLVLSSYRAEAQRIRC